MGTSRVAGLILGLALVTASGTAEEANADRAAIATGVPIDADALVRDVWLIMDTVLDRHIEPPTRQEMLLGAARALLTAAGKESPRDLSRQVSALSGEDELKQFLSGVIDKAETAVPETVDLAAKAIAGLLQSVPGGAEHIPAKEYRVQHQLSENRYVGIGIALSIDKERKMPVIGKAFARGPLHRAGGRDGDRIMTIDGQSTVGMKLAEVIDLLRGAEGTRVTLELLAEGASESRSIEVVRGVIPLPTVLGFRQSGDDWDYRVDPTLPIAYMRVDAIKPSTPFELRELSQRFHSEGMRALIFDLRNSSLGSAHHAAILADTLLSRGKIGRVRRLDSDREYAADSDQLFSGWPIVVLVGRGTRSDAEWLAAALLDNQRATIVGEPTPGDAYITEMVPISDRLGAVTLWVGILERANGQALLSRGPASHDRQVANVMGTDQEDRGGVVPTQHTRMGNMAMPLWRGPGRAASADHEVDHAIEILVKALDETTSADVPPPTLEDN